MMKLLNLASKNIICFVPSWFRCTCSTISSRCYTFFTLYSTKQLEVAKQIFTKHPHTHLLLTYWLNFKNDNNLLPGTTSKGKQPSKTWWPHDGTIVICDQNSKLILIRYFEFVWFGLFGCREGVTRRNVFL